MRKRCGDEQEIRLENGRNEGGRLQKRCGDEEGIMGKSFGVTETLKQREGITKRAEDVARGKNENGE